MLLVTSYHALLLRTLCASGQLQTVTVNGGAKRSSLLSVSGSEKIVIA